MVSLVSKHSASNCAHRSADESPLGRVIALMSNNTTDHRSRDTAQQGAVGEDGVAPDDDIVAERRSLLEQGDALVGQIMIEPVIPYTNTDRLLDVAQRSARARTEP
jgi:hypothetical protein